MNAQKAKFGKVVWLGLAVSAVFVWITVRSIDADALRRALSGINYWAVLACGFAVAMGMVCRSIRWRVIANGPIAEHSVFSRATNIGVLSNLIFPGRAGEVIRILTLIRVSSYKLPRALASAMIDRFVDVLILLLSGLLVYLYIPTAAILERWLLALGAILLSGIATVGLVLWQKDMFRSWGARGCNAFFDVGHSNQRCFFRSFFVNLECWRMAACRLTSWALALPFGAWITWQLHQY